MVGHGSTQESACEQTGQGRDSQVRWSSVLERDKAALDVRGQQALPADNSIGQREQQGRGRRRGITGEGAVQWRGGWAHSRGAKAGGSLGHIVDGLQEVVTAL